jgi:hypothetical protein
MGKAATAAVRHPFKSGRPVMKKLKLELDDLQVVSFVADNRAGGKGTVRGQSGGGSVYYCTTNQNTWAESCQQGTGCEDSINICGSHLCPLTGAPSAPDC